ncbi:hypothetical protein BH23GEM9_BH23GEM9_08040 [soil metagenome]
MPMRQPSRREGQVWLAQFNSHLMAWLRSSRAEEQHLRAAVTALRSLLEREPEVAETVSILCATLLHQHAAVLQPDLAEDVARLGLEAEQMRSDDHPLRWAERAVLQLALAHAANAQHRRFEALRHARAIALPALPALTETALTEPTPVVCLRRYFGAKVDAELGELLEAGLDRGPAEAHARAAVEACDWITGSDGRLAGLLRGLTELFYGDARLPDQVVTAMLQAMSRDLFAIEVHSAARLARCAAGPAGASGADVAALVEQAVDRMTRRGVADLTPVDLIAFFRNAREELCRSVIEKVRAAADAVQVDPVPFAVLLPAAAAAYADCEPAVLREFMEHAADVALLDDTATRAVGLGLLAVAEARISRSADPAYGEAFLQALDAAILQDGAAAHDLRLRSEFDNPIGVLVSAAALLPLEDDGAHRIRVAQLLDSLRVAPARTLQWLALLSAGGTPRLLEAARRHADDLFGRLIFALRSWPRTVAIVVHADGDRFLFFCTTADGMTVCEAGSAFGEAAVHATRCVAEQLDLMADDLDVSPDDGAIENAGRAAYDALPVAVRTLLSENDVVLICADYRSDTDAIPFEMLRCGDEWLGIAKVVTRVPSVEALVRAAEGSRRRVLDLRLLSIGVTDTDPPLPSAGVEAESVRRRLAGAGWDAPPIDEVRVDPQFILNRMPFAAHMHIAAHGVVGGAEDAVELSRGTLLTPDDVIDHSYGCTPTVWLNTCSLGQSSYLGGGAVRGVAHAFVAAGAPAVIANMLQVDDEVSSQLADRFYVHATAHDFGESLRRARRDLADDGVPSVLWGSTVLLGDPRIMLKPRAPAAVPWQQALVHAIARRDEPETLAVLADALEDESEREPDDLRLACATSIVHALWRASQEAQHDDVALLAEVCRLCLGIQSTDGAAIAAYAIAELAQGADRLLALLITKGAIGLLRPIEATNREWRQLTDRLLVRAEQLRRGDRALAVNVTVPEGTDTTDVEESRRIGEFIMDTNLAIDLRSAWYGLSPEPRPREDSTGDILWNGVMAARSKSFEDMPETIAYARHVARKLADTGGLPAEREQLAATILAGLLKWMWDGMNTVAVEQEVVEGHARVTQLALASLLSDASPERGWLPLVADYPDRIREWLGALDELPYDGKLYEAMAAAMKRVRNDAFARLQRVEEQFPGQVPDATAFLLGTLVETNTYSYLDGSVPEDICEKLKAVHHELSMQAERYLMPWLMEGFRNARESGVDELQRWCYGLGRDSLVADPEPLHSKG